MLPPSQPRGACATSPGCHGHSTAPQNTALLPHGRDTSHPPSPAVPKLLVGYRLRSRSVSRDTLLRSTSFLLRKPLSCRTSSSSAGHGAPSSSSCGNSSFQSCPFVTGLWDLHAWQTPRSVATSAQSPFPNAPSPCPPHQGSYLPAPPSGSPASQGAGEKKRKQREDSKKEAAGRGSPKQKEAQECYYTDSEHVLKGDVNRDPIKDPNINQLGRSCILKSHNLRVYSRTFRFWRNLSSRKWKRPCG